MANSARGPARVPVSNWCHEFLRVIGWSSPIRGGGFGPLGSTAIIARTRQESKSYRLAKEMLFERRMVTAVRKTFLALSLSFIVPASLWAQDPQAQAQPVPADQGDSPENGVARIS